MSDLQKLNTPYSEQRKTYVETLRRTVLYFGFKEIPSETETDLIINFLIEKKISPELLSKSVNCATCGQIKVTTYGRMFCAAFIFEIINAYIDFSQPKAIYTTPKQLEAKKPSEQELKIMLLKNIDSLFLSANNKEYYNDYGGLLYDHFVKEGRIKENSFEKYLDQAKKEIERDAGAKKQASSIREYLKNFFTDNHINGRAKEICLNEWAKYCIKNKLVTINKK